jgi:hypothetical protein
MEQAVFISDITNLQYVRPAFGRLYFGNEFCQHLLPSQEEIKKALEFIAEQGKQLSFVTPYLSDKGLVSVLKLLPLIKEKAAETEIVVNDWGLLRIINMQYPEFKPVLGRLLSKQKKGPRILNIKDETPESMIKHFKETNVDSPYFTEFLLKNRVRRIELDNLLQGVARRNPELKASLYMPYAYVTTSRFCLTRMAYNDRRFTRKIAPCKRECRVSSFKLSNRKMPVDLFLKGNTQFIENSHLAGNLSDLNIDRLVFQPSLPM